MKKSPQQSPEFRTWAPTVHGHLPALDGLRGIAILLVVVSHYCGLFWRTASVGWTGVNLFFVLSGFLITGILLDAKDKPHYFRNFYARRTLRIFPLYYLVLFLIFVVAPLFAALDTPEFRSVAGLQAWLWTYTQNIYMSFWVTTGGPSPFESGWVVTPHFWSLAVEEQFYLVWPALVLLISRRKLIAVCIACFIGAAVLRVLFVDAGTIAATIASALPESSGLRNWLLRPEIADYSNVTAPYFFTFCRMDDIAAGAFVAAMARERNGLARLRSWAPWLTILALWILLGVAVRIGHFWQHDPNVIRNSYSAFALLYGCLLVFALTLPPKNLYVRAMRFPLLRSYGKYSYAIYIFHWSLSELLFARIVPLDRLEAELGSFNRALGVRVVVVAIVTYLIAVASWHIYEKHLLALKRYFYARNAAKREQVSEPPAETVAQVAD